MQLAYAVFFEKKVDLERFAMTENLNEIYYTKN